MVGGKLFVRALRYSENDPDPKLAGQPIGNKRDAQEAQAVLMAGFRMGDETAALENIRAKLDVRKDELVKVAEADAGLLTVADAWDKYLAATNRPDSGEGTLGHYAGQWERFAGWMAKTHPESPSLRSVTPEIAAAYAVDLAGSCSSSTFNKHVALLTLVFRVLAKPAMMVANPFAEVRRKRAVQHGRRELTIEELRRVCTEATGELRTLLALGTYTGLRLGDCATMNWSECDLVRGLIQRVPNKTARRTPKPVLVPIHGVLSVVLEETPEKARRGFILPESAALYQRDAAALTKRIQKHLIACGVRTQVEGTGFVMVKGEDGEDVKQHSGKRAVVEVGFHSLRHTFVSLCREAGAPLSVVESIVGHSSPAMTRHYTHTGEAAARSAIALLPGMKEDAAPNPKRTPAARRARLLARVKKMKPAKIKRAVLRFLAAGKKAEWVLTKAGCADRGRLTHRSVADRGRTDRA
jgi:integrase